MIWCFTLCFQPIMIDTGWWSQSLWKILVNWDDYSEYMKTKKNVPNHQPGYYACTMFPMLGPMTFQMMGPICFHSDPMIISQCFHRPTGGQHLPDPSSTIEARPGLAFQSSTCRAFQREPSRSSAEPKKCWKANGAKTETTAICHPMLKLGSSKHSHLAFRMWLVQRRTA